MKRTTYRYFLWLFPAFILGGVYYVSDLYISLTDSIPYRFFLNVRLDTHKPLRYGDYGVFFNETFSIPLIKQVKGLPGDILEVKEGQVWIKHYLGPLYLTTLQNEPLTPISSSIIPEGKVFMAGDHPRSIDSRYEEVGLVDQATVQQVRPLL